MKRPRTCWLRGLRETGDGYGFIDRVLFWQDSVDGCVIAMNFLITEDSNRSLGNERR